MTEGRRRVNFEESTDFKSVEVVHVELTVLTIVYLTEND